MSTAPSVPALSGNSGSLTWLNQREFEEATIYESGAGLEESAVVVTYPGLASWAGRGKPCCAGWALKGWCTLPCSLVISFLCPASRCVCMLLMQGWMRGTILGGQRHWPLLILILGGRTGQPKPLLVNSLVSIPPPPPNPPASFPSP